MARPGSLPSGAPEYSLVVKTTRELESAEVVQYCELFQAVFGKQRSLDDVLGEFRGTPLGYCFHAFLMHAVDGLVGAYTVIPVAFLVAGLPVTLGLSVDTMIRADHRRDSLQFMYMAEAVYERMEWTSIPFVYGFPNEQSRAYFERVLGWKRLGELPCHALPVRPGAFFGWARFLDRPSRSLLASVLGLLSRVVSSREAIWPITAEHGTVVQLPGRKRGDLRNGGQFWYSVHAEANGKLVAYLVDVQPMSPAAFLEAAGSVLAHEESLDLVAYFGVLPFAPLPFLRVPPGRLPKRLFMSGRLLTKDAESLGLTDIHRWRSNLGIFDVR